MARRYEFYVLVARTISHSFASLTREILFLPLEHKIHIFSPPCNILYVFCFLGCVVKFQAREAKSWRRSASSNPGNWVCLFFFFLSFLFFFWFLLLAFFSRSNTHIHTRRDAERLKGEGEQFASLDLWITDERLILGVHLLSNIIWFVHRIKNPYNCS